MMHQKNVWTQSDKWFKSLNIPDCADWQILSCSLNPPCDTDLETKQKEKKEREKKNNDHNILAVNLLVITLHKTMSYISWQKVQKIWECTKHSFKDLHSHKV